MTNREETVQNSEFKDTKTGLVVFGIIQIIFGGFCALMVPFMVFGIIASTVLDRSSAESMNVRMMIPAVIFYAILAVWFIWMGIGSIKARRWARALILISSWLWLIGGIGGFIFVLLFMPNMYDRMGENTQMPQAAVLIMKFVMIGFMTVFYIIIPAAFVLFYGRKNVKATCQFRDPQVRWTDKCPLPVLAVSFLFTTWASWMLLTGLYGWTIPFFGFVLSGIAGALVVLIAMLLYLYMAWGTYRLNMKAWWYSVLLTIAWSLSTVITFSRVSMLDFYEKMDFPEQQLELIKDCGMLQRSNMVLLSGFWLLVFMGYLLYVRRYFVSPIDKESASQQSPF